MDQIGIREYLGSGAADKKEAQRPLVTVVV
jgi:hypothetical protein